MKVAIVGGTGFIGRPLVNKLLEENRGGVLLFTRQPDRAQTQFGDEVEVLAWNPLDEPLPSEALDGFDAVVNLAGDNVASGRWTAEKKKLLRDSRVVTTKRLVDGIVSSKQRPRVFINASAIGYYGPRGDEELDENADAGKDFLADLCVEWENAASAAIETEVRVVILRVGIVLGRGGGALAKMLLPFRLGLGGRLGHGKQWMSWIHLDDIVDLVRHALANETLAGPVNGTAPNPVRNREFTSILGQVLRRPTIFPAPSFMLRLVVGEFADVLLSGQRVVPRKAEESGYTFRYPDLLQALETVV